MRIYLDTSVFNRPFDDQSQPRIWLEALSFVVILQMIEASELELISSAVLEYENSANPLAERRRWVDQCLQLAVQRQLVDSDIGRRADELGTSGIKAMDALHLACAESCPCEYFVTCDDRVIRRYEGRLRVRNPVDFVLEVTRREP